MAKERNNGRSTGGKRFRAEEKRPAPVRKIVGIVTVVVLLVCEALLGAYLAVTQLFPTKYLAIAYAALVVVLLAVIWLLVRPEKTGRFAGGVCTGLLLIVVMVLGGLALQRGVQALNNITAADTEIAHIGVYVNTDDNAEALADVSGGTFGILAVQDREDVDKSLTKLSDTLGQTLHTGEYAGLTELIDALYSHEVRAIVLNDAWLAVLEEMEGYGDVRTRVRELTRVQVETQVQTPTDNTTSEKNDHVFTVYISGIDSRSGLNARSRSDVNILATINTETRQVLLVSTPRDYYVPLSISDGVPDKLTHAGIYGVNVSMDTIAMLYDVDVDYYFRVNFEGFKEIIDCLGGITVNSQYAFDTGSYRFQIGENYLYGDAALAFARERYAFADGDRQRGRNQMEVIRGVINKILSPEILVNYVSVLNAVEGCFETSVPYDLIASLVRQQLDEGGSWNIVSYSVNGTGDSRIPYSMSQYAYVMIPDEATVATARELIGQVYGGEVVTAPQS